ncbi:MAG: SDR family oxidoreductase [Deltaproteobacteria bacterium]|nr:SDR family oxidoreductase [Deltaproteobacteria bacterium]
MTAFTPTTVFITGASSGIGAACARAFANIGAKLVVVARRRERLDAIAKELATAHRTKTHVATLDVRDRKSVERVVDSLPEPFAAVDVLINNAGLGIGLDKLHEGNVDEWDLMIDTNIKGLLYVSRALIPGMVARGKGHVINLGSLAGREVYPGGAVYAATKYAVRALTKALRLDLLGTGLRVTTIDPGMVDTEFSTVRFRGDKARADKVYQGLQPLTGDDIADAVLFCATRPPHVDISELVLMPTAQGSTTMAHRAPPAAGPASR